MMYKLLINISVLFSFLFTLSVTTPGFSQIDVEKHEEDFYSSRIEKDPKSEKAWWEYAFFLTGEKRFAEAREKLTQLLLLNPEHADGIKLMTFLDEIERIEGEEERNQAFVEFTLNMVDDAFETLDTAMQGADELKLKDDKKTAQSDNSLLKSIDMAQFDDHYVPGIEEIKMSTLVSKVISGNDIERAEGLFKEILANYPNSPDVKVNYLNYLIRQDRLGEASRFVETALRDHPKDLRIFILSQGVEEIKNAPSSEKKDEGILNLNMALMEIALNKVKGFNLKKTEP